MFRKVPNRPKVEEVIEATEEEIIEIFSKNHKDPGSEKAKTDAEFQIRIMKGLGSEAIIGNKAYKLKQ